MKVDGHAPEFQRDALLEWVPAIIGKYSGMSRDAASDWYKEVRDQWFDGETVPRAKEVPDGSDELRRIMRAQMGLLWKDNDAGELLRYLNGVIDRNVNEIARDGIMSCAKQDKRKPKFARVPLGPTCAWCMMLAGRGWVYGSSKKAGAGFNKFHADCDCQIVPSWSTHPQVDGYDPDGIEQRYLQCRSTIENDLQKRYKQERKVYRDDKGKKHHESFSDFEQRAILAEMRQRTREWLYDGTISPYTIEKGARPELKETHAAEILTAHGMQVRFRATRAAEEKRTSDVFLGNGINERPWEIKRPTGNGSQTIAHQFEEASGQSNCLILDGTALDKAGRWSDAEILKAVNRYIHWHFKDSAGNDMQYDEVLVILNDQELRRVKRAES